MTTKVNQIVVPGFFFERDISLLSVTGTFAPAQFGNIEYDANGDLVTTSDDVYQMLNIIGTRGTVIAISTDTDFVTPANGNYLALMVGHAGGEFTSAIVAELQALITAAVGPGYTLTLGTGFEVV